MKVLLVDRFPALYSLVEQGFRDAGAEVERCELPDGAARSLHQSDLREISQHFRGKDLAVYIADEVGFGDAGGPALRQVTSWAARELVPVIIMASVCRISTRELRILGVEAGYDVATEEDVRRVVQTWVR